MRRRTPARIAAGLIMAGWDWDSAYLAACAWLKCSWRRSSFEVLADIAKCRNVSKPSAEFQDRIEKAYRSWKAGSGSLGRTCE